MNKPQWAEELSDMEWVVLRDHFAKDSTLPKVESPEFSKLMEPKRACEFAAALVRGMFHEAERENQIGKSPMFITEDQVRDWHSALTEMQAVEKRLGPAAVRN